MIAHSLLLHGYSWKVSIRTLPNGGIYSKRSDILFLQDTCFQNYRSLARQRTIYLIWTTRRSPSHPLIRQLLRMRRSMRLEFVFLNRFSDCRWTFICSGLWDYLEVTGLVGGFSEQRDFRQNVCWITSAVSSLKYISILLLSFFFSFVISRVLISLFRRVFWGSLRVHLGFQLSKKGYLKNEIHPPQLA